MNSLFRLRNAALATILASLAGGSYYYSYQVHPATNVHVEAPPPTGGGENPIPAARRYDWTYAGVPGGIPNRTTICQTLSAGATAAQINAAITACGAAHPLPGAGGVVYLNAGTYAVSGISIDTTNVTLRGAGADQTVLSGSAVIGSTSGSGVQINRAITAGGTKGTFTITVSSATNLTVGTVIEVDRADDVTYNTGHGSDGGRGVTQVNAITAVNGTVLTVRNPWMTDFTAGSPTVKWYYSNIKSLIGLEDLKLEHNTTNGNTNFWYCDRCWMKGVESAHSVGYHFTILGTLNFEVRDCYVHDGATGPNNSGINFYGNYDYGSGNSNFRVENTIFNQNFPAIEINNSSSGAYVAFNYVYGSNGGGANGVTWSLDDGHAPFNIYNLYEGNITDQFGADNYFGGTAYATLYRNFVTGYNPNFSATGEAVWLDRLAYYYNVIGNVIGSDLQATDRYDNGCGYNQVYRLGYPNLGNCDTTAWDGYSPPGGYPDPKVISTLFRWGNYDNYYDTTRWESSEVPADVSVPSTHTLASSLFYASKPSYFGAVAWPPIGPDVASATGPGGHVAKIPAQLCWESRNLGSGGTFSRTACYGS